MRVLLDENIDRLVAPLFHSDFKVVTVQQRGWSGQTNGELLRLAQVEFDAFVTMDRNLEHQQNISEINLGVIVITAKSNSFESVSPLVPNIEMALRNLKSGIVMHIPGN